MSYLMDALEQLDLLEEQSSKSAVKSSLRVLLLHMLKCKYQPEYKNKHSWLNSIKNSFENIENQFPAIGKGALYKRFYLKELDLDAIYQQARINAAKETGKPLNVFPDKCEWSKEQLTNYKFIYEFMDKYEQDNEYNPDQLSLFD